MDKIAELLTRGVANIIPSKDGLEKLLRSDKKLNVYLGIDPTAVHIHLGHAVLLRKLQTFVELGHHVTFLIGDFTARIGDTSDKDSERPRLTPEQVEANFQTYKAQAEKILDFSQVTLAHNSDWLKKLSSGDFIRLADQFTLNDFISRELIKKRLETGGSVRLPEVLYPLLQGYDSYHLDTDIQIGGTDQTFNMQAGRALLKVWSQKESFIIANSFLTGTDGRKMSKSWGNAVWLDDSPADMYGKIMSIKDDLISQYFTLATSLPLPDIPVSGHPMELKKELARQIVSELYNPKQADAAQKHFETTIQARETPQDIAEISVKSANIVDVLVETKLVSSKSGARRLISQSGVKLNRQTVSSLDTAVAPGDILSIGNRKFIRIA